MSRALQRRAPIKLAQPPQDGDGRPRIAALDLGSNSFHLVLAWVERGVPHVYDQRRENVSLGRGLRDGEPLDADARGRALACLERFGPLLRPLDPAAVRVVGTDALRRASDGASLVTRGERLLGHAIEIVPGYEEARLIWQGVSAMCPPAEREKRLVVDIGGGSTELISGIGWALEQARSTPMGCIRFTERHFARRRLGAKRYGRARDAALLELRPFAPRMAKRRPTRTLGASGTMRSIGEILAANGWSSSRREITCDGVARLAARMLEHHEIDDVRIEGLSDDRRPVLPGGLAIVDAVMEMFELPRIEVADGALREGLLMEILGRLASADVRDDAIAAMAERHAVDRTHARHVRSTAETLADAVAEGWKLDSPETRRWLGWAAELHEVGLSVAHTGVARHGAYLIANADAPGFSREALQTLSLLVRTHRGRLDRHAYDDARVGGRTLAKLASILRVAVALHADRRGRAVHVSASVDKRRLRLHLSESWLGAHPLVSKELVEHASQLEHVGIELAIETRPK